MMPPHLSISIAAT